MLVKDGCGLQGLKDAGVLDATKRRAGESREQRVWMSLVNPIGKIGESGEEELGGWNDWLQHLINVYCH